jgi:hypothetical protein
VHHLVDRVNTGVRKPQWKAVPVVDVDSERTIFVGAEC